MYLCRRSHHDAYKKKAHKIALILSPKLDNCIFVCYNARSFCNPEEVMKRFWKDLKEHYKYALYSAKSELKSEVANSYLNWIWWVLEPFCFMLIYTFIFGYIFNTREPFFSAFVFIGLTTWEFFNISIIFITVVQRIRVLFQLRFLRILRSS